MIKNLEKKFYSFCKKEHLEINTNQIELIKRLNNYYEINFKFSLLNFFSKKNKKKGFYLYGDVGVGKTMILNFFFNQINTKKLRFHFTEFMMSFHNYVHEKNDDNQENIINSFVKNLKSKGNLIYFDEFQVTNIVDAMILGKLFSEIFKENIKIIVTSNTEISELYKDGLQRDQFKPFIKIMKEESYEHNLTIEDDYRKSKENQKQRFFHPLNEQVNFKINKLFRIITKDKKRTTKNIYLKGRNFEIRNFYNGIVRFTFDELCNQNLGSEDYLEIVKECKLIVIENIPHFNEINSNQQLRFITLLDIIYDKSIPLAVTANQSIEYLSSSKSLEKPFKRTISRLYELTSINI